MERFQTVNGGKDTMHPFGALELLKPPPEVVEAAERARTAGRRAASGRASSGASASARGVEVVNYGPCLYFGPRGERCERRATATGFCRRHSPSEPQQLNRSAFGVVVDDDALPAPEANESEDAARAESIKKRSRILFALLGLAGVLWPVLNEMLRALISFLHSK
jgi:hypothetical protein